MSDERFAEEQAWQAFHRQDYQRAGQIWLDLMRRTDSRAMQNGFRYNYTFALRAQGRFWEAEAILQELFDLNQSPEYLHQMGSIAHEEGHLTQAKALFLAEKAILPADDHQAQAANAHELCELALQQADWPAAHEYADESLCHAEAAADALALGTAHRLLGDVMKGIRQTEEARYHYSLASDAYQVTPPAPVQPQLGGADDSHLLAG